ncbi:hypothetical protein A8E62_32195 [Burkholderia cenocepacia]|uniref:Uncharacterized protein n=1 Tax=Burkholderia cenocepacia TaxID=95486 RepID=A0A1V2VTZ1_9BURK|nr:hypothetical protein A8E62_32195 [Burkholderia cenocepacia]ONU54734.1 hypothetical protein A8E68_34285 [Burkholderia cenocepacia]ONU56306.1 hypothetical protein A8E67_25225 [Burkholderia cenocepacia]ONU76304.1 hypothetical protein A8E72_33885 [Burkholderia cenocepacia]ONU79528.1 hypothetical protein A8E73_22275 [Burkholderia cenocepacia]
MKFLVSWSIDLFLSFLYRFVFLFKKLGVFFGLQFLKMFDLLFVDNDSIMLIQSSYASRRINDECSI